ncbi:hypothetical protein STEG23_010161 [Scotinomys teguina]
MHPWQGLVTQSCNSSFLGDRGRRITVVVMKSHRLDDLTIASQFLPDLEVGNQDQGIRRMIFVTIDYGSMSLQDIRCIMTLTEH